jgi:hypothetical protein
VREGDWQVREAELLAEIQSVRETMAQMAGAHAQAQEELRHRLGEELHVRLVSHINCHFQTLLDQLEESLCHVLTPFLSERARIRAISDLAEQIDSELRQSEQPVLEFRVPSPLHGALSGLGEKLGVSMTMSEAEVIEVIMADRRLRFQELSANWCAVIAGEDQ